MSSGKKKNMCYYRKQRVVQFTTNMSQPTIPISSEGVQESLIKVDKLISVPLIVLTICTIAVCSVGIHAYNVSGKDRKSVDREARYKWICVGLGLSCAFLCVAAYACYHVNSKLPSEKHLDMFADGDINKFAGFGDMNTGYHLNDVMDHRMDDY